MSSLPPLYRLTVPQYDRMVEAGLFGKERIELINGLLVAQMPRSQRHIVAGNVGLRTLGPVVPPGWHVIKRDPIVVSELSKPEPDLAVIRGDIDDYDDRHVTATDAAFVVEIGDSSNYSDQLHLKSIYAAGGVPIYWIINLVDRQLEVYSEPEDGEYRRSQIFSREQEVPLIIAGVEVGRIRVADLMPWGERFTGL
jgi:Uma2 family endonuclease